MNSFEVFQIFNALKQHFNSSYDYFKYNGKIKNSVERFNKLTEPQRYPYKKISEHNNPFNLILSHLLHDPKVWIGNIKDGDIYKNWAKKQEALTYNFKNDLEKIDLEDFFVIDGNHPKLLIKVLGEVISLETLIILNTISEFFEDWTKAIKDDIVWPSIKNKALKYAPFIKIDREKFRGILIKHFEEN